MVLLNMRGVRESVIPLVPIFLTFLATHVFVILYGLFTHLPKMGTVVRSTQADVHSTVSTVGFWGLAPDRAALLQHGCRHVHRN